MWGGIPFMMASVVKIRRKSWGAKSNFAENDDHPQPIDRSRHPASNVISLTERRLAQLPADTRPLPSVTAYDQLLRLPRRTAEGNRP
jgi:hypothetical protein